MSQGSVDALFVRVDRLEASIERLELKLDALTAAMAAHETSNAFDNGARAGAFKMGMVLLTIVATLGGLVGAISTWVIGR